MIDKYQARALMDRLVSDNDEASETILKLGREQLRQLDEYIALLRQMLAAAESQRPRFEHFGERPAVEQIHSRRAPQLERKDATQG